MVTNLKVAQALLLPYKMKIDICTSGPLSIELVKKNKYDLVFMDHMMPGMDGIEATAAIRAWEKERQGQDAGAGVPVIALTANAVSGMKEMFLQRGFDDYLAKPIELPKLQGILEKWLPPGKQIKAEGAAPQPALGRLPAEPGESFLSEEINQRRNAMNERKAKKIILAVDDMPPNLAAIKTVLCNDYDIRLAKSPLAALGMLNTTRVDLILLDVEMPEMSGFEFLERLRGNSGIEQPPVIFVTSHETPDVTARALSGGAGYVVKPIVPRVLLEKVKSVLEPR
jgi:CheY-like chemotaxis protein